MHVGEGDTKETREIKQVVFEIWPAQVSCANFVYIWVLTSFLKSTIIYAAMAGATELDGWQKLQQNGTDGAMEWEYNGMVWLPVAASGVQHLTQF